MSEDSEPETLTTRAKWSLGAVMVVQAQNAFNDNFVKFVLMGLAMAVAAGTAIGENIEFILSALIPLPFILIAPVAGYLSDRYAKSRVIWHCLVLQLVLFILIGVAILLRSIEIAVIGFFFLAVQSTLFSPAKQGILKEIVGSNRLGFANGLMSMLTMVGILGGMWVSGQWFDQLLDHYNQRNGVVADNAWRAALIPVFGAGVACIVALLLAKLIITTPDHPEERFSKDVWLRHFRHLKELFSQPILRRTALFITAYWFVANFLGLAFVQFAKQLFPEAGQSGRMTEVAMMLTWVGGGLVLGSSLVSFLSRKRILLALSPLGAMGMGLGLAGTGLFTPASLPWDLSLAFIGFASGFLVVPLNAWLQDQARDDHRARIISALNLMTAFSGVVAIGAGSLLKSLGLGASGQTLCFAPFIFLVGVYLAVRLPSLRTAA